MKVNSRLNAVLLLFTVLAAVPAVWPLEFPPTAEHPAGCHDSMPESPSPNPANHQCCAAGHDWAVTVSVLISHPAIQLVRTWTEASNPQPHPFNDLPQAFISDSPPTRTVSLKI